MKSRDFKTHAAYFNILSPVSELSHYRICSLLGQRFRFAEVRAKGVARKRLLRTGNYSRK